ncbi:MAG: NAD-dependent epimerase/dehydratase family protein [Hyphomonadaceae bacterium]|nr:NAD-dependent epimerase/dehydratase family protein [Hyphomonadaceae bacterium]
MCVLQNDPQGGRFFGRKVLVTGASGFIGSHLCARLIASGADVHAVSRYPHEAGELTWHRADLTDIAAVRAIVAKVKPDIVYHLASHVSGSRALEAVQLCASGNLFSTINVLTAVTEAGCERVILAGSLEEPQSGDETPSSPYAVAKGASTAYARMFHALYRTPVVMARLFMVYGPGQYDLKKLVPYVTVSLLRNTAPALTAGGRDVDWIYVEDVVSGLVASAHAQGVVGERVDLGSGKLVKVRDVALQLAREIGSQAQPQFGAAPERAMEQIRVADPADAFAKLSWRPSVGLQDGLKRTVAWYAGRLEAGTLQPASTGALVAQLAQ